MVASERVHGTLGWTTLDHSIKLPFGYQYRPEVLHTRAILGLHDHHPAVHPISLGRLEMSSPTSMYVFVYTHMCDMQELVVLWDHFTTPV